MKLTVDNVEFILEQCIPEIALNFQEEFDSIVVLALMCDYDVEYGYNSHSRQMHCYFKKDRNDYRFTLSLHQNKDDHFTQYSIFNYETRETIYRKKGSSSFWKVLKNFKRML